MENLLMMALKKLEESSSRSFTTSFPSVDFLFALLLLPTTQEWEKRKRWDPIENDLINEDEVDKF